MTNKENYIDIGKNLEKLINATEMFNQFLLFQFYKRDQKNISFKIGTFEYEDGWIHDIYCNLKTSNDDIPDIFFTEVGDNVDSKYYRLTDMCFGWGFGSSIININFKMLKDFYKILSNDEKSFYTDLYYEEVHPHFW